MNDKFVPNVPESSWDPNKPLSSGDAAAKTQSPAKFQTEEERVKAELDAKLASGEINGIEYNRQLIDLRLPDREDYQVWSKYKKPHTSEWVVFSLVIVSIILAAVFINKIITVKNADVDNTLTASNVPDYSDSKASVISSAPIQVDYKRPFQEDGMYKGNDIKILYKAYYDITGVVTSVRDYHGPGAYDTLVPRDLCIAWGGAANGYKAGMLTFRQGERYCSGLVGEVLEWSNNHPIPSSSEVYDKIMSLSPGDEVRLVGYLVKVEYGGISLDSSMTRNDTGCEIIYVTKVGKK